MRAADDEITAWLGRTAHELAYTVGGERFGGEESGGEENGGEENGGEEDGEGYADLAPLRQTLDGVEVVGFADSTHGTREFFEVRHRLLRFLVTEMNFRNLFVEAGYSAAQPVNDYILHGRGDRAAALTGLGFAMWDVEEFASVVDWLRDRNAAVADEDKVRFYGVDIWNTRVGRERVLDYFDRAAPRHLPSVTRLFDDIAATEASGPLLSYRRMLPELLPRIREVSAWLVENRAARTGGESAHEVDEILRHVLVMSQWIRSHVGDDLLAGSGEPAPGTGDMPLGSVEAAPAEHALDNYARSRCLAENVFHILDHQVPDHQVRDHRVPDHRVPDHRVRPGRSIIWGHLFHLGAGFNDPARGVRPNMGNYLRKRFGRGYYVFGLEFDRGAYLARRWPPGGSLGDYEVVTLPPAPRGSVPWHLARAGVSAGQRARLIDLRTRPVPPAVRRWLATPAKAHTVSWCYRESPWLYTDTALGDTCDGVIFIADTTATTPTAGARQRLSDASYH